MNSCEAYQEHLSAYVDGELNDAEISKIKAHLEGCAECLALHELFLEIKSETQNSAESAPPELLVGVMNQVRNMPVPGQIIKPEKKPISMRTILTRYAPLAACLAIVIFAIPHVVSTLNNGTGNDADFRTAPQAIAPAAADMAPDTGEMIRGFADVDAVPEAEEEFPAEEAMAGAGAWNLPEAGPVASPPPPPPPTIPAPSAPPPVAPSFPPADGAMTTAVPRPLPAPLPPGDPMIPYQDGTRGERGGMDDMLSDDDRIRDVFGDPQYDVDDEYGAFAQFGLFEDEPYEQMEYYLYYLLEYYFAIIRVENIELPPGWLLDRIQQVEDAEYSAIARITREAAIILIERGVDDDIHILSITLGNEYSDVALLQIM